MRNDATAVFVVHSGHGAAVECGSTLRATTTAQASTTPPDAASVAPDGGHVRPQ
jgi:hypothetical protein